ncbi:DNA-binding transcriptional MocR family regulator [Kibdelosporangium banguiense]|uniref:DNA-binding transcriptional MocR family regulator n=1 Tax=Kibdelosporangium banguiense TaxID=1365924 RepID=A0ABS4TPB0_9PSEU|nr:PLP-dependent aminotransferase family protein [Kibdelosporangium banguiense]MBP2325736.1 DNA-binding transcriptional MocR family regulator [Kibdelosporangium banguiense]
MDRLTDGSDLVEVLGDWTSTSAGRAPLYRRLAEAVRRAIHAGDLHAGERLPSERDLARALAVSRATVVSAYDELRSIGLVDSRRGSGTRVVRPPGFRPSVDGRSFGRATPIINRPAEGPGEIISLARAFDPGAPHLRGALLDLVHADLPALLTGSGYHPAGLPELRSAVATHLSATGLPTEPKQVVITTGAQQAIGLITQMYLRRGWTAVVETPSWPGCLDVFRATGVKLVGVELDAEGIRADLLSRAMAEHGPDLLYVMPTYHNPTGVLMSTARRRRIVELAARYAVPVVEDHAYSVGAGEGLPPPIGAFAGTGAEVLTIGSLAKSVWAGLRVGWVRASIETAERLARHKALADLGSPVLDQALAARLLPQLPELNSARAGELRERLGRARELLTQNLPEWRWRTPDGGSALWIELPNTDARIFAQVALRHGVEVVSGATTDPSGAHDSHIRFPFAYPDDVLTELVHRLTRAWAETRR